MDLIAKYLHPANDNFPFLAIIGVSTIVLLLVTYYVLVIKCCLSWNRRDHRHHRSSRSWNDVDPSLDNALEPRGLDEALIRAIPVFEFKKRRSVQGQELGFEERSLRECAVCLNEYEEYEKLKIVPNCCHVFHMDCIDVWLRDNDNCPLCRTKISAAETASQQDKLDLEIPSDGEGFLAEETGGSQREQRLLAQGRSVCVKIRTPSVETRVLNKCQNECIDIEDELGVPQRIRRSASLDSVVDRPTYLTTDQGGKIKPEFKV